MITLQSPDPLLRLGAIQALRPYAAANLWPLTSPLLADPVLAVRIEAPVLLADVPAERLRPEERARLARALDEYVAAQRVNADRPEHRVNLGMLYASAGSPRPRPSSLPPAASIRASRRRTSALPKSMPGRAATRTAKRR